MALEKQLVSVDAAYKSKRSQLHAALGGRLFSMHRVGRPAAPGRGRRAGNNGAEPREGVEDEGAGNVGPASRVDPDDGDDEDPEEGGSMDRGGMDQDDGGGSMDEEDGGGIDQGDGGDAADSEEVERVQGAY